MEFKKKTIIWEDNNEPPKNYMWVKSDGNAYEFNHTTRQWEKIMSSNGSGSSSDSGNLLISLIPSNCPKPDLFLYQRDPNSNPIDVTNYKIEDLINLCDEEETPLMYIMCLYENSTLSAPIISNINFSLNNGINLSVYDARNRMQTNEIVYNNKTYYFYFEELI